MPNDAVTAHSHASGGAVGRGGVPARSGLAVGSAVYDGGLRTARRGEPIIEEQPAADADHGRACGWGPEHVTSIGHGPGRQDGYRPVEENPIWRPTML
jgi:hypothetical protein